MSLGNLQEKRCVWYTCLGIQAWHSHLVNAVIMKVTLLRGSDRTGRQEAIVRRWAKEAVSSLPFHTLFSSSVGG